MDLLTKQKKRLKDLENELIGGKGQEEGIIKEFGLEMYILLYLKQIANKDLPSSTRNSAQCYVVAWMGRKFGGEWIHVYA